MAKISALRCGDRLTARSILFSRDTGVDMVPARFQCWLIESGSHRILIDAGIPADDPRLRALSEPRSTRDLCLADLDQAKVTDVVLTHLHWDHVGDVDMFDNAAIHVQARELDFLHSRWLEHAAIRDLFAAPEKIDWITGNPRLHRIEDQAQIASGVTASWVGGHTPGSQIVTVELDGQSAVFTGDAANTIDNIARAVPPGIVWNMPDALDALARIRELQARGHVVIPAHEASELPWRDGPR